MKTLFLTLLLVTLCATGYGQTLKSLGYNTTNGEVVYTGTNALTFTTEVNAAAFRASQLLVSVGTNTYFNAGDDVAEVFVPLQLFNAAGLAFVGTNATAAAAATRTNLSLGATWLTNTNVTNFRTDIGIPLPALTNTNNADFRDAIELGATNNVTFSNVAASGTLTATGAVTLVTNLNVGGAIAVTNAAETRTNLGLLLEALAETSNVTMMRALAGSTNTNEPFSGSVVVDTNTLVFTNGILLEVTTP
jgi:hypothetical protein